MATTGISGAADAARVLLTQQSAELAEPDRASQQPGRFAALADSHLAEAVSNGRLIDVCLMLEAGVELEVWPLFAACVGVRARAARVDGYSVPRVGTRAVGFCPVTSAFSAFGGRTITDAFCFPLCFCPFRFRTATDGCRCTQPLRTAG